MSDACTHHWTVTSPCPFCQQAELAELRDLVARYEAAAKYPGTDERHRGTSVAVQLVHAQHKREKAEQTVERLRALLAEARERELRYVLPLYRDKNYIARLDSAINAAKKEG